MPKGLTRKQKGFVKDYIKTGNGTDSVKKNYDVASDQTARAMAYENLTKPHIVKSIQDSLPDDLLAEHHNKLFKQVQTSYFAFPKSMSDKEIIEHVNANGIDVITVRESDKGKLAFYTIPDANAIKNGLDMAYKLKGSYAAEKSLALNVNVGLDNIQDEDLNALREEYEAKLRSKYTDEKGN